MPINFFQNGCKTESDKVKFGLCDDIPNASAYIDESDESKWIGIVNNPEKKNAEFYAIDNCVSIRKVNGDLESRCDGVLKEGTNLVFVELKERESKNWFGDGRKQITNTINIFKNNHDITEFTSITAHVCNSLKPAANRGRAVSIQMFKDDTGFILKDIQKITI
ncbi:hypothetical protein [Flavobacterium cerinum]|uniref:Uncharacterized protein n=1 Tax=Flavobacterium cerinum TaxID=2502784 RepID=A0A3S3U2Q4_9FLAO|nr:hypothetical protein [Flavobacterium cerinum]RWX00257.1 hypothetical protein EPI11_10290 [Flavobacterium cerinum]